MRQRLLLLALGLGLAAGGFVGIRWVIAQRSTDESARIKALEARLALLEKQGSRTQFVTRTVNAGESQSVAPTRPAAVMPEEQARAGAAPTPRRRVPIDEVALQREYFGDLDVRLAAETRDPVWSAATEEKLRGSARDLRPRIYVENAQCGQSMCRVETSVPDPRDDSAALDKFVAASLDLLPEAVIRNGDGPGRHTLYFARQGSEFPPLSPPEATAQ
jgi:hypothetical protein